MFDSQDLLPPDAKTILIVEDDRPTGEVIQLTLMEELSLHTFLIADPYEALDFANTVNIDLWIIDYLLPGMNGLELYDRLHADKTYHLKIRGWGSGGEHVGGSAGGRYTKGDQRGPEDEGVFSSRESPSCSRPLLPRCP